MNYTKLFNYMSEEHGVTLLIQDMQEICNIVNEMQSDEFSKPPVSGQSEQLHCDNCADWKQGNNPDNYCLICNRMVEL